MGIPTVSREKTEKRFIIRTVFDAIELFQELKLIEKEHFGVAFLNSKNEVLEKRTFIVRNYVDFSALIRDVLKGALGVSATSIVCVNNPESRDVIPSEVMLLAIKQIEEVGKLIGLNLLDHIILVENSYVSLKEKGYIN